MVLLNERMRQSRLNGVSAECGSKSNPTKASLVDNTLPMQECSCINQQSN